MRVITFSTAFPSYHPRKGEPTYFVEKIWRSYCEGIGSCFDLERYQAAYDDRGDATHEIKSIMCFYPKHHTIRTGNRWKVGDQFSPRIWSGKPYRSPQIAIAPDMEVKKVWNIGLRVSGDFKEFYCNDCDLTHTSIAALSLNDGLDIGDLFSWFNKPFEGQIICWNESIVY